MNSERIERLENPSKPNRASASDATQKEFRKNG
jgi:hypothetical protein